MSSEIPKDVVLDILTNESSDSEIEVKPKTDKVDKRTLAKKGNRSEKQIEACKKMMEKRKEKQAERKVIKDAEAEVFKKELEEKIVSKAVSIKKKQIKKKAILEIISDDDEAIESVMAKVRKINTKTATPRETYSAPTIPTIRFC
jgi:wyosine [tRNA(Phe)-imidazoG37] synthetase (radical SAM superfamily)